MAKQLYYAGRMTDEQMNSGASYRIKFSYGTYTISPTNNLSMFGLYYYAYKRQKGKLFKVYVGKCGEITKDKLHRATMKLNWKIRRIPPQKLPNGSLR